MFNPIKSLTEKHYKLGHSAGYIEGIAIAGKQFNLSKQDNKPIEQEIVTEEKLENESTVDDMMLWLGNISEILNTQYFKTSLCENAKSTDIKAILGYLEALEYAEGMDLVYPVTYANLPELLDAFEDLYDNKLAVEEAENMFKGFK